MLKARIVTALALLAGFLCVLFLLPQPVAAIAFAMVAGLAGWEWAGLMRLESGARMLFAGFVLISCWLLDGQAAFASAVLLPLSVLFWLLIAPLWLWRGWQLTDNNLVGYLVGWLLLVPTWIALVALHGRSPLLLLATMALVWMADIAAYFSGRAFGRHKLAPSISPGKTWEGAVGAVVGVLCYGGVALLIGGTRLSPPIVGAMLILLTAVSILGDLFESMIKRQAGVKDSSGLLPGHGGILDRIDSQTSTLPLAALLMIWLQA
jgi:phosphatidate cytidylyltransferase